MADARIYLANLKVGLACKLYSRTGGDYRIDDIAGVEQLIGRVKDMTFNDDDFTIVYEGDLIGRVPENRYLWEVKPDTQRFDEREKIQLALMKQAQETANQLREENIALKYRVATLGRQLIDAKEAAKALPHE